MTTGRGGMVLASFRCNFTLKASGTGFARPLDIETPGNNVIKSSHMALKFDRSLLSARDTVLKKAVLNFSLNRKVSLISEGPIFENDKAASALLRHSSIDASSTPSRRFLL